MKNDIQNIENLVFKGGGVLGIAYAGAIEILEQMGVLKLIKRVAGTSAGAITACLISLKCTSAEILEIVNSTDFKSFEDHENVLRVATKYGLYKGDAFLDWLKPLLVKKGLKADATFADMNQAGFLDLHVFATCMNRQGVKRLTRFSFADTPNVIVAEAVRASMSIPLFFDAWKFTNSIPDNHLYIDGGMLYNFPLTTFDTYGDNKQTLGFFLNNISGQDAVNDLDYNHLIQYTRTLLDILEDSQNVNFETDSEEMSRSVIIDNLGISSTNFSLTDENKKALYESGKKYTLDYINKNAA